MIDNISIQSKLSEVLGGALCYFVFSIIERGKKIIPKFIAISERLHEQSGAETQC